MTLRTPQSSGPRRAKPGPTGRRSGAPIQPPGLVTGVYATAHRAHPHRASPRPSVIDAPGLGGSLGGPRPAAPRAAARVTGALPARSSDTPGAQQPRGPLSRSPSRARLHARTGGRAAGVRPPGPGAGPDARPGALGRPRRPPPPGS